MSRFAILILLLSSCSRDAIVVGGLGPEPDMTRSADFATVPDLAMPDLAKAPPDLHLCTGRFNPPTVPCSLADEGKPCDDGNPLNIDDHCYSAICAGRWFVPPYTFPCRSDADCCGSGIDELQPGCQNESYTLRTTGRCKPAPDNTCEAVMQMCPPGTKCTNPHGECK